MKTLQPLILVLVIAACRVPTAMAVNLLANPDLDNVSISSQQNATPTNWVVNASRNFSGPNTDGASSENFANVFQPGGFGLFYKAFQGNLATGDLANVDLYQDVTGQPGVKYMLTGWAGAGSSYSGLLIGGETHSQFAIDFLNSSQAVIGGATVDLQAAGLGNANGNPFGFAQYSVSAVAPPGTAFVRSRSSMIGGFNNSPGDQAFVVDSFDLTQIQTSSLVASGTWTAASGTWSTTSYPNNGNGGFDYDVAITSPFTVTIPAATNMDIDGLTLGGVTPGGTIVSNGSLTVHAATNWTTGTLAGTGTVNLAGTTTISGNGVKTISGTVINSGTMTWQGGQVGFVPVAGSLPQLQNSGTIQLQGDGAFLAFAGGQPSFVNQAGGTLRQLSGPGISQIDVATTNQGTIDVQVGGALSFTRGLTINNGGQVTLHNGMLSSANVNVASGGHVSGSGTITGNVLVGTDNGPQQATFSPGFSTGHVDVNGSYQQGANGALLIDVTGTPASAASDTVSVTGNVDPGGTLTIDATNFTPSGPFTRPLIQIISASSVTAGKEFDSVQTTGNKHVVFIPTYVASGAGAGASGGSGSSGCAPGMCVSGFLRGDMNENNVLDPMDVPAFALALSNPNTYHSIYGIFGNSLGDVDGWATNQFAPNGKLDFDDIDDFAALIAAGTPMGSGASVASIRAEILRDLGVPEPTSAFLLVCGGCALVLRGARRLIC
jgi:hypothetical protein